MGHRKSTNGRNSVYTHNRRGMPIGGHSSSPSHGPLSHSSPVYTHNRRGMPVGGHSSSPSHGPLSHSSPVRQPSKPPRKVLLGNGGNRIYCNGSDVRPSPLLCIPRETGSVTWNENINHINKSPISLSFCSDGGSSVSSSNSSNSKCNNTNNTGSSKKSVVRPSNPLRYKTELCRSFEESGECRFGSSCTFAHGLRELRAVLRHPRYKTDLCRTYHGAGYCQYGARCHFVHDPEEASGVAGVRARKLRNCPALGNMTMLAFPERSNTSSIVSGNNFILGNLQRLHACKLMDEKIEFLSNLDCSSDQLESIGTLSPESSSMSLDILAFGQSGLLDLTSHSQLLDNVCGTPINVPETNSAKYCIHTKSPKKGSDQIWRHPPMGSNCWDREPERFTESSVSDFSAVNSSTAPGSDIWNHFGVSTERKSVIGNPMEVSRNLLIPTISELIHMP